MEDLRCPACNSENLVAGHVGSMANGQGPNNFFPHRQLPLLQQGIGVTIRGVQACASCGHVWGKMDPAALGKLIVDHGTELARQQWIIFSEGPEYDLPDHPRAKEAARHVYEVDRLVLADKQAEATRRYRELSKSTWDEAVAAMRGWQNLERSQKLARFGWIPPEDGLPDHPKVREASGRIAELDLLILSGKQLEATRRYREIRGITWERAAHDLRHWQDMARSQKLELFGWVSGEKGERHRSPEHPLHDPILDT
ncbi:hypothetical protein [Singulisphaera sp. PoT]|uniref:hypothetical protein n=1 Tax=Singulisphaera sp. PoT TaxID=3411797 RepID=UPI003BF476F9